MKFTIGIFNRPWKTYRTGWYGFWGGLAFGVDLGMWLANSLGTKPLTAQMILPLLSAGIAFITLVPEGVVLIRHTVHRYRSAARRQPHL